MRVSGRTMRSAGWVVVLVALTAGAWPSFAAAQSGATPDARTHALVAQMTLDEKIAFVTGSSTAPGYGNGGSYDRTGIARLGIPPFRASDSGLGIAAGGTPATQFPAGLSLASTFSPGLARRYGTALGREAWLMGINGVAGPVMDLARHPYSGRNFEGFGEDPLLTGRIGAGQVAGMQTNPIAALVKHYNLNTQELNRQWVDARVGERALREIYTRPWAILVRRAEPGAVMCAFNKVNGEYACGNHHLLTDILKHDLGFQNYVTSDYNAAHSTDDANAGLDFSGPSGLFFGDQLRAAVQDGTVPAARLDDMVFRILRAYAALGLLDDPPPGINTNPREVTPIPQAELEAHDSLVRRVEDRGIVLLKNARGQLPLSGARSIAVIGGDADSEITAGPASVFDTYRKTPILQGIRARAGSGVTVDSAPGTDPVATGDVLSGPPPVPSSVLTPAGGSAGDHGLHAQYWANPMMAGDPTITLNEAQADRVASVNDFSSVVTKGLELPFSPVPLSARWTGTLTAPATGDYALSLTHWGTARLIVDGRTLIDNPGTELRTDSATIHLATGQAVSVEIQYMADSRGQLNPDLQAFTNGGNAKIRFGWTPPAGLVNPDITAAADLARRSDVAVVVVRDFNGESVDRGDLRLPQDQDTLIDRVARANRHTIVVLATGGPVLMPWLGQVPSVLEAWYGGQEQGQSVADVLFGDANPSGKLPMTFPRSERAQPIATQAQYPGLPAIQWPGTGPQPTAQYSEGVFVGYRGYDRLGLRPLFPFGHGLSYTSFAYRGLSLRARNDGTVQASFTIRNTGARAGAELAQVYAGRLPTSVATPPRQLAGWARVRLAPGASQRVTVTLNRQSRSYWSTAADRWVTPTGRLPVYVGSSSRDLRLTGHVVQR